MRSIKITPQAPYFTDNSAPTKQDNKQKNSSKYIKTKYKDPLDNWPIKGMAYSDRLGTAIIEIAPKLGAALWIPSFMYMGADIYDKYKNDANQFSPSRTRGFERAIFQGIMNLVFVPMSILIGQKAVSPVNRLIHGEISSNAKDAVIRHTKEIIDQSVGEQFDDIDKFKELVKYTLKNKIEAKKNDSHTRNFITKTIKLIKGAYALTDTAEEKIMTYADKNTERLFKLKEGLLTDTPIKGVHKSVYKKYKSIIPLMEQMYGGKDSANHAMRTALKHYQNSLIFKNKLIKTLGGFVSLIVLSTPIDRFVEKTLMEKYLDPEIDEISHGHLPNMFKHINDKPLKILIKKPDTNQNYTTKRDLIKFL